MQRERKRKRRFGVIAIISHHQTDDGVDAETSLSLSLSLCISLLLRLYNFFLAPAHNRSIYSLWKCVWAPKSCFPPWRIWAHACVFLRSHIEHDILNIVGKCKECKRKVKGRRKEKGRGRESRKGNWKWRFGRNGGKHRWGVCDFLSALFFSFLPKLHFQFPFLLSLPLPFPFPLPSTFHLHIEHCILRLILKGHWKYSLVSDWFKVSHLFLHRTQRSQRLTTLQIPQIQFHWVRRWSSKRLKRIKHLCCIHSVVCKLLGIWLMWRHPFSAFFLRWLVIIDSRNKRDTSDSR